MSTTIYEADAAGGRLAWVPADLECLQQYGATSVLLVPPEVRATCNGVPVVGGIQALRTGDLLRIGFPDAAPRDFCVGAPRAGAEAGEGRLDDFTGLRIEEGAVRCPQCRSLYAERTAGRLKHECPSCHAALGGQRDGDLPPEELL